MRQCGFEDKLTELGLNRPQIAAAVGNIVARMAHPGSELATHAWLQQRSALGELIGFDFEAMDLNRLYRASDALYMKGQLRLPRAHGRIRFSTQLSSIGTSASCRNRPNPTQWFRL